VWPEAAGFGRHLPDGTVFLSGDIHAPRRAGVPAATPDRAVRTGTSAHVGISCRFRRSSLDAKWNSHGGVRASPAGGDGRRHRATRGVPTVRLEARIGESLSARTWKIDGRQLDMWCWDYGDNVSGVSTWSWVGYSSGGTSYYGWVSDYFLTNRGALFRC
jgi:hypothetical protein